MIERFISVGLQYGVYVLELGLLVVLVRRGLWRRLTGVSLYVALLLLMDAVTRPYFYFHYGSDSSQFRYCYWLTDVLLTLAAFVLISVFFRRACAEKEDSWPTLRLLLTFVFILVLGISCISLSRNYKYLFTHFIIEFQQNLYFACAVLNTLLYIMMQQTDCADDELGLLVCGLGIQFAGPAAGFALVHLTHLGHDASSLFTYLSPLCALAMLLVWLYAMTRAPKAATARVSGEHRGIPLLAEVVARGVE